jgi:hypothetical protein
MQELRATKGKKRVNASYRANRQIFFEAAIEVSDIEKIACIMQKMFFIQATMFFSNEKIILNMGTIFSIMEKII